MVERMETRPPALMARLVRALIPPASREHVLGDLNERYVSPRQYVLEALRALPYLIASRLRRTTHPIAFLLGAAYLWWCVFHGFRQESWLAATIPTAITLVTLTLRNVYRASVTNWRRTAAVDMLLAAFGVLLSQAVFALCAPQLVLARGTLLVGFPFGFVILYFVCLQSPSYLNQPPSAARSITLADLRAEIGIVEKTIQRAVLIEIGAAIFVGLVFLAMALWPFANPITRTGNGLIAAASLFVWWFLHRYGRVRPIPASLDFSATIQAYRDELERRIQLSRSYFWWYIAPFALGFGVLFIGPQLQKATPLPDVLIGVLVIAAVGAALTFLQSSMAKKARRRSEQLATVSEKIIAQ